MTTARDLMLAGVANTAEGWVAYAYSPGAARKIFALEPHTPLRDGQVAAIDANGVTFTMTDGKSVTLALR